ncbi:MAG: insulinase family protein [Geminocystis sp.]|nr:insulinase family protein [Geminocystis sp.]HIK38555.1 insulinase family protein [Geminocystis sp. M7585_C2015_104]
MSLNVFSEQLPDSNPRVTVIPDNGLTIITEQVPVPAVTVNVWFKVGSAMETPQTSGMAHFLEHMIFKGSRLVRLGEFERILEAKGGSANAATSHEYTHYYFTATCEDFAEILPLQLDLVTHPSFPPEEFEREKKVIQEEIRRAANNPRRRLWEKTLQLCFPSLPYHRPILGEETVIANLTLPQMRAFHQLWYQPANTVIVAVGNLPADYMTETIIQSYHPHLPSPDSHLPHHNYFPHRTPEPPFTKVVEYRYKDPSLQQARIMMFWRVPGLQQFQQTLPLDVLAAIVGRGKLSRLVRDLRESRRLVTRITAANVTYQLQGLFYISAQLPQENIPMVTEAISNHIQSIQSHGVREEELNRVKHNVTSSFIFQKEKPSERTNLYGYYYSQLASLKGALEYEQYIKSLSPHHIQLAASQYLSPSSYGIVIAHP